MWAGCGAYVVGLSLGDTPYAFPYAALYYTPVVIQAEHDQRAIVLWSAYANRVLAFRADSELRGRDPQVYARISEVRPLPPRGFALFDRRIGAFVYANEDDVFTKWRDLAAIARSERFGRGDLAYVDLRFADRVVIKPVHAPVLPVLSAPKFIPSQITN